MNNREILCFECNDIIGYTSSHDPLPKILCYVCKLNADEGNPEKEKD